MKRNSPIMPYGSQDIEPMDTDTPLCYGIEHLKKSYKDAAYPISYLLTDIGNRLLLTAKAKFNDVGDPLIFMQQKLKENKSLYEEAKLGLELKLLVNNNLPLIKDLLKNQNIPEEQRTVFSQITEIVQKHTEPLEELTETQLSSADINSKIGKLDEALESINNLISDREDLNNVLTNAFPFAQRCLPRTFIDKWKSYVSDSEEQEIIAILKSFHTKVDSLTSESTQDGISIQQVMEFLSVKINTFVRNPNKYKKATIESFTKKVEKIIGREPTSNEITKYRNSHPEMEDKNAEEITAGVREYIADNSAKIQKTMQGISKYMLHPDYLEMLRETNDFLFQTFTYRHMSRDLQKVVLVEGNAEQRNIPPGINSTIKITAGGSATVFLGELGSYKEIGETNTATLANYQNYFCNNGDPVEKEALFRSLHQIEAIRSSSALLTNAMFFELAEDKFAPKRLCPEEDNWQYSFNKIATHMPMAMKGAVSGAIFLNDAFDELLTSSLPYDYRFAGDKKNAEILHSKNNNILFDFLLWKSGINDLTLEKIQTEYEEVHTEDVIIDGITHSFKTFNLDSGYEITYELLPPIKHGEDIESHKFNNFIVTAIHSFPANVLNKLLDNWYGTKHETEDGTAKHTEINNLFQEQTIELSPPIQIIGDYFDYVDPPDATD